MEIKIKETIWNINIKYVNYFCNIYNIFKKVSNARLLIPDK